MKVPAARVDRFLDRLDASVRILLLYGPDAGLVRERAERVVRTVVGDLADPFRVAEFRAEVLRSDPARLRDEASALALMGGRRVIRLRDAGDPVAEAVADVLEHVSGDSLVVIEAGELPARSRLRRLCEEHAAAAALPCYPDEAGLLSEFIRETLSGLGVAATSEAVDYLATVLGADRMVSRSELEKLALYAGPDEEVTLEDAIACVGDSGESTMEDVAFASAAGDGAALRRALGRAYAEGTSPIAVLRTTLRHFDRLHFAAALMAQGASAEEAMRALRPPVFFKREAAFRAQLRAWGRKDLGKALAELQEAEVACKSTGVPAESVCGQVLASIARANRVGESGFVSKP
jgi:DNA polymerase-3 subunit delta